MIASLSVERGSRIALAGQSGSGKSTLLDMLALVSAPDPPEKGSEFVWAPGSTKERLDVSQDWKSGSGKRREAVRRRDLGYILQSGGLLPFLSVRDNILVPARLKKHPEGKDLEERLEHISSRLGIQRLLKKLPSRISVGERQRAAAARALIHSPSLLLADEPTASLDPPTAAKVFELFLELAGESGAAVVLATHNRDQAERFGFAVHTVECEDREGRIVSWLSPPAGDPEDSGKLIVVKTADD
jgi:putative ABC transport system ATP-binding protein